MDSRQASQVSTGLLLIVIGLLFLGEQLHIGVGWGSGFGRIQFGQLWPVILLTLGATRFLTPRADGRWPGGIWLIFLGGLFLMHTHDVVSLRDSWPLFIVAGGLSLMLSGAGGASPARKDVC